MELETQKRGARGKRQDMIAKIAEIAKPWLTLATLAEADRETLLSLANRCRLINRSLGIGGGSLWSWVVAVLVLLTMSGVVALTIAGLGQVRPAAVLNGEFWFGIPEKYPIASLIVAIPGAVAITLFILRRLLRS
jgi:hypothetical protein